MLWGNTSTNIPSRFLGELPAELVRDVEGARRTGLRWTPDDEGPTGTPGRSVFGSGRAPSPGADGPAHRAPPPSTGADRLGLAPGDTVVHATWGAGTVVEIAGAGEESEAVVVFASVGRKKLLLRMAPLTRA